MTAYAAISSNDLSRAMSDKSEYNPYAGCVKVDHIYVFSTATPESFLIQPVDPTTLRKSGSPDEYETSDLTEDARSEWVPATIDGLECFILICRDRVAFMDFPNNLSEVNWIN